jgi:hypothetical protein
VCIPREEDNAARADQALILVTQVHHLDLRLDRNEVIDHHTSAAH